MIHGDGAVYVTFSNKAKVDDYVSRSCELVLENDRIKKVEKMSPKVVNSQEQM